MPRSEYQRPFVITAQIWEASTRQSMRNIFGSSDGVMIVPPRSGRWPAQLLQRRLHLVNCHGAHKATEFFGQPASGADEYPIALRASYVDGQLTPGTVAAAECCYGGQLEGISRSRPRMGICETYLKNGCWGFVGSSTVAYGDFERNANADLLCQFFLEKVLAAHPWAARFLKHGSGSCEPHRRSIPLNTRLWLNSACTGILPWCRRHCGRQGAAFADQQPPIRDGATQRTARSPAQLVQARRCDERTRTDRAQNSEMCPAAASSARCTPKPGSGNCRRKAFSHFHCLIAARWRPCRKGSRRIPRRRRRITSCTAAHAPRSDAPMRPTTSGSPQVTALVGQEVNGELTNFSRIRAVSRRPQE